MFKAILLGASVIAKITTTTPDVLVMQVNWVAPDCAGIISYQQPVALADDTDPTYTCMDTKIAYTVMGNAGSRDDSKAWYSACSDCVTPYLTNKYIPAVDSQFSDSYNQ